ncbi:hypothetical protein Adu01nite_73060 [Paractinoplanes durhamensis]|uniref:Uncharacterized protein n=1 Tax=Paractinoplanes durhamensis TaxID=113563 RepID=A0ABQ3Z808_9ACTN|nr:hypothetical protein Adu01nite_73060 [Actinoplanes durhamensis]
MVHQQICDFDADGYPFIEGDSLKRAKHLSSEKLGNAVGRVGLAQRDPVDKLSVNPGELRLKRLSKNGLVQPGGKLVTHPVILPH